MADESVITHENELPLLKSSDNFVIAFEGSSVTCKSVAKWQVFNTGFNETIPCQWYLLLLILSDLSQKEQCLSYARASRLDALASISI